MTTPMQPGTQIVTRAAPPSRSGPSTTGTWHIAVIAERGPTDTPRLCLNLSDYDKFYGTNRTYTQRDAIEAHFRNGGGRVNVIRVVGPAATKATGALPGPAAALSLSVDSVGEGPLSYNVAVTTVGTGFTLSVVDPNTSLAITTSPVLFDTASAASWGDTSPYIRVRATGTALPVATAAAGVAVAGGVDDRASVTDVHRVAAINRIPRTDGPGQVSIPGATTSAAHQGIAAHCELNNRFGIYDSVNTAVETDHTSLAAADRAAMTATQTEVGFLAEGWHNIPGTIPGTTRVVPPSAIVSAMMSRKDALTGNPNDPAAGLDGIPSYSLGITRAPWSDAARLRLNQAGVNVFRLMKGQQRLYGYRTLVDPASTSAAWLNAANARLRMGMQAEADDLAEPFVFDQITKSKIGEYNNAITGMCLRYYRMGALYGDTPGEAFIVNTGPGVNTPERIASRRLSAVIGTRMSEFAEVVYMEFVKVAITEALA